jgi:hypothetical protein
MLAGSHAFFERGFLVLLHAVAIIEPYAVLDF